MSRRGIAKRPWARADCEDVQRLSNDFLMDANSRHDALCQSFASGFTVLGMPDFDEAEIRSGPPDVAVPMLELQMEIRRDVIIDLKDRVALNDLEEQDLFEAEQLSKAERDANMQRRGRPKKIEGELLSEASRMLRVKALHINLTAQKARESWSREADQVAHRREDREGHLREGDD